MTINIEKLAESIGVVKSPFPVDYPYQFNLPELQRFAEAYAAKVLEEQSAEIAQLKGYINDLREALNSAYKELLSVIDSINKDKIHHDGDDFHETLNKCEKALPKTPAQHINNDVLIFTKDSLQEHDNEVIEKCARVVDESYAFDSDGFSKEIRTLKT